MYQHSDLMAGRATSSGARPKTTKAAPGRKDHDRDGDDGPADISLGKVFIVVLALAALLVGLYIQVTRNISDSFKKKAALSSDISSSGKLAAGQAGYETLVVADNMDAGYLDHIIDALLKFNHKLSFSGSLTEQKASEENLDQFDLIWTHDYPFQSIKKLRPNQRINHFPGTGFITNKLTLSTTPRLPHILKAFRLPHERERFVEFAKAKQAAATAAAAGSSKPSDQILWIRKGSGHRGISIETLDSILAGSGQQHHESGEDFLVQEYMSNPLLVDGKKFDIGIYAVLTSVEPLRVYIYESEALLRFCAQTYLDPITGLFNATNIDSYVVGDDYTPIWLMPSLLRHYIGTNLSMKQTLNTYLARLGKSGAPIWSQIEETIMSVYKMKEHHLARMSRMYQEANNYNGTSVEGSLNQFFEMVRFDFIVDEELNVYLMEANMSPNLSSRHFPPNRLLYEQVLNSYFSLVGLSTFAHQHLTTNLPIRYLDGQYELPSESIKMQLSTSSSAKNNHNQDQADTKAPTYVHRYGLDDLISEKELSVYEELCVSDECHMNCEKLDCKVCYFCLNKSDKLQLRRAIFEQYSRWNFKRLLPSTRDENLKLQLTHPDRPHQYGDNADEHQVDSNYIHVQWFRGKCFTDKRFCTE